MLTRMYTANLQCTSYTAININTSCPHIPPYYYQLPTSIYILPLLLTSAAHTYMLQYMLHKRTYVVVFKQDVCMDIYAWKQYYVAWREVASFPGSSYYVVIHTSKCIKARKKKTARNGEGLHGLPLDDVTNSRQRTSQRGIHGDSSLFPQICSL